MFGKRKVAHFLSLLSGLWSQAYQGAQGAGYEGQRSGREDEDKRKLERIVMRAVGTL